MADMMATQMDLIPCVFCHRLYRPGQGKCCLRPLNAQSNSPGTIPFNLAVFSNFTSAVATNLITYNLLFPFMLLIPAKPNYTLKH